MYLTVAPLAGAWIEISLRLSCLLNCMVAPLAGAWIEIPKTYVVNSSASVAPLAGAWIEILSNDTHIYEEQMVAPLAGAWIEIADYSIFWSYGWSLPSRERGLKCHHCQKMS